MQVNLSTLEQRVSEFLNDWISVLVTTNIGAGVSIVSTNLQSYDNGSDTAFYNWWVYITDKNNAGVERQVSAYTSSTGTLTVRGSNLSADSTAATIRLYRYKQSDKVNALNRAIDQIYPSLHKKVDDYTLSVGNILPNSHFEDWTSSSYPDKYSVSNATAAATTTAGLYRGGAKSAKATASAANGYMYITSNDHPALLDLMDTTIDFEAWAYPEVANDAYIEIYTIKADGTTQTLTSTTTCPAGKWTLLSLTSQGINDDIVEIQFRFKVATNAKYAYFDHARVTGVTVYEYLLPITLQKGDIHHVSLQTSGDVDSLKPDFDETAFNWDIKENNGERYLLLREGSDELIRLEGVSPLGSLSAQTDSINLNNEGQSNLLAALAAHILMSNFSRPLSSEDTYRAKLEDSLIYQQYQMLLRQHAMPLSSTTLKGL